MFGGIDAMIETRMKYGIILVRILLILNILKTRSHALAPWESRQI